MEEHLFPMGDTQPHWNSRACPCRPSISEHHGLTIVFHHYADGREIVIEAEVAIGLRCESCWEYINEKGEHIAPPPPIDEI